MTSDAQGHINLLTHECREMMDVRRGLRYAKHTCVRLGRPEEGERLLEMERGIEGMQKELEEMIEETRRRMEESA